MSYIGLIGATKLDKTDSSLGLLDAQKTAVNLLKNKVNMQIIKQRTGWEMGVDKKWRYELNDTFHSTAEIENHIKRHFGEPLNIRYCMHDATLLIAYPAFERLQLYGMYMPTKRYAGYFNPANYSMVVCMGTSDSPFDLQTEGILLHEVQHLIQEEENFARGGSLSMGRRRYWRMAGEVESRNICIRHLLSKEQRQTTLRTDTQDVPDNEQIISFV